jgi:protein SCO1/2
MIHFFKYLSLLTGLMLLLSGTCFSAEHRRYERSVESYVIPDVVLINQDGKRVRLKELLETDKPLMLDFIYGTCTTICPILSASYSNLQRKLGEDSDDIQLVSISIDPEYDTPEVMTEYLKRYQAKPGWDYLTGNREDINEVMRAFDAYVQDKMSHYPLTFVRSPDGSKWIRIYGLIGTSELKKEYEALYNK